MQKWERKHKWSYKLYEKAIFNEKINIYVPDVHLFHDY